MSTILKSPLLWLLLYTAMVGAVTYGMFHGRRRAQELYGGSQAQEEWDKWRTEVKQQAAGKGPVERRIPKSAEPPALVLMRDHFASCLGGALVVSSALFVSLMFLTRGALSSETTIDYAEETPAS